MTVGVVGVGLYGVSASAAPNNQDDSLADKIATKFNLKKDDVQSVVTEYRNEKRAEHRQEHQKRLEERLSQAVKDGKLTEDQKSKILEYLKSQSTFFEGLKDKSEEERKTARETHREEVKKWASDNGIDLKYVLGDGRGMGRPHGNHHDQKDE